MLRLTPGLCEAPRNSIDLDVAFVFWPRRGEYLTQMRLPFAFRGVCEVFVVAHLQGVHRQRARLAFGPADGDPWRQLHTNQQLAQFVYIIYL